MRVARAAAGMLILSAAMVWAQSASPGPALANDGRRLGSSRMVVASPSDSRAPGVQGAAAPKRLQEMEATLRQMHALLKQMRAKAGPKDAVAKANLEMWQLMLGQLDKQFEQLRTETLAREDFNARRAALYKQAEAKAAWEAARARSMAAKGTGSAEPGSTDPTGVAAAGATAAHGETETTPAPASSTAK